MNDKAINYNFLSEINKSILKEDILKELDKSVINPENNNDKPTLYNN